jgi:hypothetical protein
MHILRARYGRHDTKLLVPRQEIGILPSRICPSMEPIDRSLAALAPDVIEPHPHDGVGRRAHGHLARWCLMRSGY